MSVLLWLCLCVAGLAINVPHPAPVSLFRDNADELKMYAAVLAASEPLREQRDKTISKSVDPFTKILLRIRGVSLGEHAETLRSRNSAVDDACYTYESITEDIIKNYGLSVSTFNDISRVVSNKPAMRQKVMLQAYYFRLASELQESLKLPTVRENLNEYRPSVVKARREMSEQKASKVAIKVEKKVNQRVDRRETLKEEHSKEEDSLPESFAQVYSTVSQFERFCVALHTIEEERLQFRISLQKNLGCSALPDKMCETAYLPAMSSQVQHACDKFRTIAADICRDLDVDYDYFNTYSEKLKTDPVLQFKVKRILNELADRR